MIEIVPSEIGKDVRVEKRRVEKRKRVECAFEKERRVGLWERVG